MTPAPIYTQPRCSRTPCHTSHAPPISAMAAAMNRVSDFKVSMMGILPVAPTVTYLEFFWSSRAVVHATRLPSGHVHAQPSDQTSGAMM